MAHGERAARNSNDMREFGSKRLGGGHHPRGPVTKQITSRRERRARRSEDHDLLAMEGSVGTRTGRGCRRSHEDQMTMLRSAASMMASTDRFDDDDVDLDFDSDDDLDYFDDDYYDIDSDDQDDW